jgi:hypothetical protein
MKKILAESRATLVGTILSGSWRPALTRALDFSESELDEVTPLLYGSGAAALGWWRVRQTELNATSSAQVLHQAYRLQTLQSAIHEEKIKTVFRLLRESSIDPILVKGWAAANLYPDRALRPYGDIDLCVRPSDYKTAAALLAGPEAAGCWVDLHHGFDELKGRTFDQLFERSQLLELGKNCVRVLSAEDHLALLAIHLLKHGAWRPLWLCDIGAAVESLPSNFSWDICLGRKETRADWIVSAIGLANRLLGARIDHLPIAGKANQLPNWLVAAVLKQWQNPYAIDQPPMSHPAPMANYLRHPSGLFNGLKQRWPDPILATISVNGKLNNMPRLPYQIVNCISRIARFIVRLPALTHGHDLNESI